MTLDNLIKLAHDRTYKDPYSIESYGSFLIHAVKNKNSCSYDFKIFNMK